jgi:hypothetical protein
VIDAAGLTAVKYVAISELVPRDCTGVSLSLASVYARAPHNGTGAARLPAGKSLENCAFHCRETTDFDCLQWSEPVWGLDLLPAEVQRLWRRTVTPVI